MTTDLVDRFGRLALAAMFINAVSGKLTDFGGTISRIAAKGIPAPVAGALLAAAIVLLILGSFFLGLGRDTRLGASLLLIFRVPTTLIFHAAPIDAGFIRNLSLIGALLLAITRPVPTAGRR